MLIKKQILFKILEDPGVKLLLGRRSDDAQESIKCIQSPRKVERHLCPHLRVRCAKNVGQREGSSYIVCTNKTCKSLSQSSLPMKLTGCTITFLVTEGTSSASVSGH